MSFFSENRLLSSISTLGIGGPARYFVEVRTLEEMKQAFIKCNENKLPFFILGKGSNCLFDDRGFNGCVILNKIDFIEEKAEVIHVGAGYSFSLLGTQTARQGLTGLEFASGIPGSVGGAVYMNAGANGMETSKSLTSVDFLSEEGLFKTYQKEELAFSYRTSSFQKMKGAIIGATFSLKKGENARSHQLSIISYRTKTQPYGDKSAGCMFRNPIDMPAGALIEKCGLKGLTIGGAAVSSLHANFIVNKQNATSTDIMTLVNEIKTKVKIQSGIELETEVRFIPYE